MTDDQHRSRSGLVALAAAALLAAVDGLASGVVLLGACALALVLIWFNVPLSEFVGRIGIRHIARPSPPGLVRAFGWVFLVVLASAVVVRVLRGQ